MIISGATNKQLMLLWKKVKAIISGTQTVGNAEKVGGLEPNHLCKRVLDFSLFETSIIEVADSLEYCPLDRITRGRIYAPTDGPYVGDFYITVEKIETNDWIRVTARSVTGNEHFVISKQNGVWGKWGNFFLPLIGGEMSGYVRFLTNVALAFGSLGDFCFNFRADGSNFLLQNHDNKTLMKADYNGITEINGGVPIHSDNVGSYALPIGGGSVSGLLGVKNGAGLIDGAFVADSFAEIDVDAMYGTKRARLALTYRPDGTPGLVLAKHDGTNFTEVHNILHTGNSAPVKIQSTAPSDTSALWVW